LTRVSPAIGANIVEDLKVLPPARLEVAADDRPGDWVNRVTKIPF
jgi:hypothetical protein